MEAYLVSFCTFMIDVIISFLLSLLDRALPTTGLSAQQSKALGVLVLLGDASFFLFGISSRLSSNKARDQNKTAKLFPPVAHLRTRGGLVAICIVLFFFLPVHLLHSFLAPRCSYWSLTLEPPTFARKKGGSKTLILNPPHSSSGNIFVLFVFFLCLTLLISILNRVSLVAHHFF